MAGRTPNPVVPLTDAQRAVVDANLGLVGKVLIRSPRIVRMYDSRDDAFQQAMLGLISAAKQFETPRGLEFSTLAWPSIYGHLVKGAMLGQLVVRLEGKRRHRVGVVCCGNGFAIDRKFAIAAEDGHDSAGIVEDGFDGLLSLVWRKRHREVVRRHYRDGETMESIAASMGTSRQRVHQLIIAALRRIRTKLAAQGRDHISEAV